MINTFICVHCSAESMNGQIHLGQFPACNRFQSTAISSDDFIDIALTQCQSCGLIQLSQIPPIALLTPRIPWLHYNEPEHHLDNVVERLLLSGLQKNSVVCGIGPFDDALLLRLENNVAHINRFNLLSKDEKNENLHPYLETIQSKISPNDLCSTQRNYDLVICRYLLEHCHNPINALKGLQSLLSENGQILIEVPDSSKFLSLCDYSFIWEEHTLYFTESSLINLLSKCGLQIKNMWKYESQLENALIALVEKSTSHVNSYIEPDLSLFQTYASLFLSIKDAYQQIFRVKNKDKKIVIFGAGHQAIMFVHAFDISASITFLLDDDINKQGCFLPGTTVPIVSSSMLLSDSSIDVCLLAIHPRIEHIIQKKFDAFIQRGGKMYSIFHGSDMPKLLERELCV